MTILSAAILLFMMMDPCGIILFLIAIHMVFGRSGEFIARDDADGEPFIVPPAIPLIAGPSAMATLLLLVGQEPQRRWAWALSLVLAWGCGAVILMFSDYIGRIFGKKELAAAERLMGLVLTTVSVEMFILGLVAVLLQGAVN